ncbi:hypothetical protein TeGR_g10476 [Tetraparma gracilis]|uniref:Uncharacterized protein n=1 Tax=Tetraparma gracilis TaxID=2962635 RepID=A0ABQ6N864_9STRA|nr:hypothetical protein TeGR_g10476 [Tetraparma gracilis]
MLKKKGAKKRSKAAHSRPDWNSDVTVPESVDSASSEDDSASTSTSTFDASPSADVLFAMGVTSADVGERAAEPLPLPKPKPKSKLKAKAKPGAKRASNPAPPAPLVDGLEASLSAELVATLIGSPAAFRSILKKGGYDYLIPEPPIPPKSKARKAGGDGVGVRSSSKKATPSRRVALPPPPAAPRHPLSVNPKDFEDGYLKHITFHEARQEAQRPLKEAQDQVSALSKTLKEERGRLAHQIAELCGRFRRHRVLEALKIIAGGAYKIGAREGKAYSTASSRYVQH